jgi:hypothetical protein
MTIVRILIVFTFLICSFDNVKAQFINPCNTQAKLSLDSDNTFPNEMDSFKFYGKGKLSEIIFGVSTVDNVHNIFGTPLKTIANAEIYDYDSDWRIIFSYFKASDGFGESYEYANGDRVLKKFVIKPEYIGKINAIRLQPKKNFPFNQINYPDKSVKESRREKDGYYKYIDRYGLTYQVFDLEVGRLFDELGEVVLTYSRGDVMEIEYRNPCRLDKNIYVEQK